MLRVYFGCLMVSLAAIGADLYKPAGKRDPFRRPAGVMDRNIDSVQELESYSLDSYVLKAILKGIGAPKAMFQDPNGRAYIVTEGVKLGRERATVSRILNSSVILTEKTQNYRGEQSLTERVISLPQDTEKDL